jgi:superfamily II DNA/RNA helicase
LIPKFPEDILGGLKNMGLNKPSKIQALAIPEIMNNRGENSFF